MTRNELRLLYYVDSLSLGGANQTTLTIAIEMKKRGHQVVFASGEGPLANRLAEAHIPHVHINTKVRHPSFKAARALIRAVRQHGTDLICPNGFDCTMDAIPAALLTRRPAIPTYGGLWLHPYPHPWLPIVNMFSMELASDLVNRFGWPGGTIRSLIARIDGKRFHTEVQGESFSRKLGLEPGQSLILMVCRQDTTKLQGALALLDAAMEIRAAIPKVRIVLLGDGNRRDRIMARVLEINGLAGEQFILAPGSTTDTPAAFAAADLVVANGARSALEALACGKPVISIGPNGFCGVLSAETIEGFRRFNFDKGRLAGNPIGDRKHLVQAVRSILGNDALRGELCAFSADYARQHLLIQTAAEKYENLYREAMVESRRGRWNRLRVGVDWIVVLVKYYKYLYHRRARRKAGEDTAADPDTLMLPPHDLDPDWRIGLAGEIVK